MTLEHALRANARSLNAIRLGLALLVLLSHAFYLGGFGSDPGWPIRGANTDFGRVAVGAFFALSGLLITMSAMRRTPYEFVSSRVRRILPAYAAVLVVTAFALAPVIWWMDHGTLSGYFHSGSTGPFHYVTNNLQFPLGIQQGISDVFATTTPYGDSTQSSRLNQSLWTLPMELRCYALALVVVVLGRRVGVARVAALVFAYTTALLVLGSLAPSLARAISPAWLGGTFLELVFVFLCGALLGIRAGTICLTPPLVLLAAGLFVGTSVIGGVSFRTLGLGALAVLLPALATRLPERALKPFENDLSYGTYIWGWPVQQTLAYAGLNFDVLSYVLLSAGLTLVLAAGSWFLVERPLLRRRSGGLAPWMTGVARRAAGRNRPAAQPT